jgi:hypothetical protein
LPGIDHDEGEGRRSQRGHHGALGAPGRFEHNERGAISWRRVTRAVSPGASLGPAQQGPVGRRAISRCALATSIPTHT